MECDGKVIAEWARKLAPLCGETPATCEQWLAGFLTAIRLARCEALPEEVRACGHSNPVEGWDEAQCADCGRVLARREGHTEAGVYWTAGEVIERAGR